MASSSDVRVVNDKSTPCSDVCPQQDEAVRIRANGTLHMEPLASIASHPGLDRQCWTSEPTLVSQRQIIMLLHGHLDMLVLQHRQRPCDPSPCRMRLDDVVDIAAFGGDEGGQEAVFVFPGPRGDLFGVADVGAEDDF